MIEQGMIMFSNNKKGLLPKLIRWFTNSKISHCAIVTFPVGGITSVQEASDKVQIKPYQKLLDDPNEEFVLYKIKDGFCTPLQIADSLRYCHAQMSGESYGKFQLIWFVWRAIYQKIYKKLPNSTKKNWFTQGIICSELVYWFLYKLNFRGELLVDKFNPDIIQAQDLLDIVEANPHIFEESFRKGLT